MEGEPEDPSFQCQPPQGYLMSGKRMVWVPCPCVVSLAISLVPCRLEILETWPGWMGFAVR